MRRANSARLFINGGSQAVRLPREFRFAGDRVRVRRTEQGVLLKPMFNRAGEWLFHLDEVKAEEDKNKGKAEAENSRHPTAGKPASRKHGKRH